LEFRSLGVRGANEFEAAFRTASQEKVGGLFVLEDVLTFNYRNTLARLAADSGLPAMYGLREFAEAGGFIAYGPNLAQIYRRAATYVDKILRGAKAADLPVEQPTRFELLINLKAAKALGISVPPTLRAVADEVIE
jgi:putative tryptophan/tyrosine transport system substrate-binding protein